MKIALTKDQIYLIVASFVEIMKNFASTKDQILIFTHTNHNPWENLLSTTNLEVLIGHNLWLHDTFHKKEPLVLTTYSPFIIFFILWERTLLLEKTFYPNDTVSQYHMTLYIYFERLGDKQTAKKREPGDKWLSILFTLIPRQCFLLWPLWFDTANKIMQI